MLVGLMDEHEGDVHYSRTERHLFFTIGHRLLISRQVEGQFPVYERILPKAHNHRVELQRDILVESLRRADKVTDHQTSRVDFALEEGAMVISAQSQEVGDADERIQVDYTGDNLQLAANNSYIQDFLGVANTERVAMQLTDARSAIEMQSVGGDSAYRYVVMPLVK
jgi:DNA polymerase-3 subunit beta